ncbi:MAG: ATP-binding protein [Candidatus Nitrosocosmicus sp.]
MWYNNNNENITHNEKTRVIYGEDETTKLLSQVLGNSNNRLDTFTNSMGPILLMNFEHLRKAMKNVHDRGIKIRCISEISEHNLSYCKDLTKICELRHLDGIKGWNTVNETEYISSARLNGGKPFSYLIYSNVEEIVEQQQLMFDGFWNTAVPAEHKIREIEQGHEKMDIISKSSDTESIYLDLLNSASKEIMLLFPSINAFWRQHRLGVVDLIFSAALNRNIRARILVPKNEQVEQLIENTKSHNKYLYNTNSIEFRPIQQLLETRSTILIVDNKVSLVMELKDDAKQTFREAIGLSIYSNSRPGVLSYVSIFENLWKVTELYHKLEKANEQLKRSEKLQRDFIHIAAHELKNPLQPILGLSGMIMNSKSIDETEVYNIMKIVNRNAQRLLKITNDLLDIAKIETSSLILDKEIVDLRNFLTDNINEYKNQVSTNVHIKSANSNSFHSDKEINVSTKLILLIPQEKGNKNHDDFFIAKVDKLRISQIIFNLLDNAYKFTNEHDTITVQLNNQFVDGKEHAMITIKDTGKGIDQEIIPKLFTKFATKSDNGTGLGLFICKSIVEAHGGRIWGKNNEDTRGATFSFSLPLFYI